MTDACWLWLNFLLAASQSSLFSSISADTYGAFGQGRFQGCCRFESAYKLFHVPIFNSKFCWVCSKFSQRQRETKGALGWNDSLSFTSELPHWAQFCVRAQFFCRSSKKRRTCVAQKSQDLDMNVLQIIGSITAVESRRTFHLTFDFNQHGSSFNFPNENKHLLQEKFLDGVLRQHQMHRLRLVPHNSQLAWNHGSLLNSCNVALLRN